MFGIYTLIYSLNGKKNNMQLLSKEDLKPLFVANPNQNAYTLKRYFHFWQKKPYLARFKLVLKLLGNQKFDKFIDIGFGSGIFLPELKKRCKNLYGIDIHSEIETVKKIIRDKKITADLQKADINHLPFPDNFFDGVLCLSVLEFISDTDKAVSEIKRVAKSSATIIVGAPVLNSLTNFIYNKIIKFKKHSKLHKTNHEKIIDAINKEFEIIKILKLPSWLPLNHSLFFVLKAKNRENQK